MDLCCFYYTVKFWEHNILGLWNADEARKNNKMRLFAFHPDIF